MPSAKPEKAAIINVDVAGEPPIECLFNPTEYTFSKKNTWKKSTIKAQNTPQLEFTGGDSMLLKMTLFFDTYTTGGDVRLITNRIWKLMRVSDRLTDMTSGKGRPPMVEPNASQQSSIRNRSCISANSAMRIASKGFPRV